MGVKASKLPWLVLITGLSGATGGHAAPVVGLRHAYPLVITGKPLFSWPAFVPVTFELGVLGGALGAVFGMLAFNQLPMLFHPLFASKRFRARRPTTASSSRSNPGIRSTTRRRRRPCSVEAGAVDVEVVENG